MGHGLAVCATLAAYLIGSISFATIVARRAGVDVRRVGSGNPGATNVGRVVGKRAGYAVLLLDMLKGALPTGGFRLICGDSEPWLFAVGLATVLGHCFPAWHRGGGKGAATGAGAMLASEPRAGLSAIATYWVLKKVSRRASVGSLGAAVVGAAVSCSILGMADLRAWMAVSIAALVWLRHVGNIERLLRGEEPAS